MSPALRDWRGLSSTLCSKMENKEPNVLLPIPVIAPALTDRDQPVVSCGLQPLHLALCEVHGARLDLAHLELSQLAGELFEQWLVG